MRTGLTGPTVISAAPDGYEDKWFDRGALVLSLAWLTVVLLITWPALFDQVFSYEALGDSAVFAYAGELIRKGGAPYVSFWDHKAPLIFLIDAAGLAITGGRVWGIWLLNWAALVGAILLGHRAMRRAFGPLGAMLGTVYFAFSLPLLLPSNLTEGYALPLQWAAVLLLVRWRDTDGRAYGLGLMLGIIAALSFFLRPNLIGAQVSVVIALSIKLLLERRSGEWLRLIGGGFTGVVIVAAVMIGYLAFKGSLAAFWDQAFRYSFLYAKASTGLRVRAAVWGVREATAYGSLALSVAGWMFALARLSRSWRREPISPVLLLALIWLPMELLLAAMSGRKYPHYFVTILPPLALLASGFGSEIVAFGVHARSSIDAGWPRRVLVGAAAAIALLSISVDAFTFRDSNTPLRGRQIAATAEYVRTHSAPNAPLLVWGQAVDVYFLSGRPPASRFIYSLPLLTPGYADSALVRGFMHEVEQADPQLIIDATANPPKTEDHPSLGMWKPNWRFPTDQGDVLWWSMTPAIKEFYDYVAKNYAVADTVGPSRWVVYRRLGAAPVQQTKNQPPIARSSDTNQ